MNLTTVSFQAFYQETRFIAERILPAVLIAICIIIIWRIGKQAGRWCEQKEIKKYMPEFTRSKIAELEAKITELEQENINLLKVNNNQQVLIKFTEARCNTILEQISSSRIK